MLSPKNKRILLQIIPFGIIPLVFSVIYTLIEKGIIGDHPIYPSTGNTYTFGIIFPAFISMLAGLIAGLFEIFILHKKFQHTSLFKKLLFKTTIYLFIIMVTTISVVVLGNAIELGINPFAQKNLANASNFLFSFAFWSTVLYFTMAVSICLFYNEVSDYIGQAVLWNFFTGKYHRPLEEERIFMFLDMKSSTTIAEKLGHVRYFRMLKAYYVDLSDSIIQFGGEIYQYVGDEVIVTWKLKKGFATNNYLHCFFSMQSALQRQAEKYQKEFGVIPTFKAGIHLGKVTTGEIGVIKKEITFSGDVLNTTARIQGLCNHYQVDILLSEELIHATKLDELFHKRALGETTLRGRNEKVSLFTIEKRR